LGIIRAGDGWFSDAMCVLADIVFYFVPDYLLGPRLVPMLITLLILAHMALPLFHAGSYYFVYAFFKAEFCSSERATPGEPTAPTLSNGGAPTPENRDTLAAKPALPAKPRLCQKCQLAFEEKGGAIFRSSSTPLLKPIETTC
jgi:hypothetical protein